MPLPKVVPKTIFLHVAIFDKLRVENSLTIIYVLKILQNLPGHYEPCVRLEELYSWRDLLKSLECVLLVQYRVIPVGAHNLF